MNVEQQVHKSVNAVNKRKAQARSDEIDEKLPALMTESRLEREGPPPEKYNYKGAVTDNVNLMPDDEGGHVLPNKYASDMVVAGRNINSGEQVDHIPPDSYGYISEGQKELADSSYNTKTGHPDSDIAPLSNVFRGIYHAGGSIESAIAIGWPDPMVAQADKTGKLLATVDTEIARVEKTGELQAAPPLTPEEVERVPAEFKVPPLPEGVENITVEEMAANPTWLENARSLYGYENDQEFEGNDQELHEWAMTNMSDSMNQLSDIVIDVAKIASGSMPPEVTAAYVRQWQLYEQMESFTPEIVWNTILSSITDPTVLLTGGGALAYKMLAREPIKIAARSLVMKAVVKRYGASAARLAAQTMAASGAGAVGGGAYSGAVDARSQAADMQLGVQDKFDIGRLASSTAVGAGVGATVGFLLPGGVAAFKKGIANHKAAPKAPPSGSYRSQGGWIGPKDKPTSTPKGSSFNVERYDYGVDVNAESVFYSRVDKFIENFPGKDSVSKETLIRDLEKGGKHVGTEEGFSAGEVADSGIIGWLNAQPGKKVSKEKLSQYMYMNRMMVNMEVSGPGPSSGKAGTRSYPGIDRLPTGRSTKSFTPEQQSFFTKYQDALDGDQMLAANRLVVDELEADNPDMVKLWQDNFSKEAKLAFLAEGGQDRLRELATKQAANKLFPTNKVDDLVQDIPGVNAYIGEVDDYAHKLADVHAARRTLDPDTPAELMPSFPSAPKPPAVGVNALKWANAHLATAAKAARAAGIDGTPYKSLPSEDRPRHRQERYQVFNRSGEPMLPQPLSSSQAKDFSYRQTMLMAKDLTPDQLMNNLADMDEALIQQPAAYKALVFNASDSDKLMQSTYFEARAFIPMRKDNDKFDIAEGYFNSTYDELSDAQRADVDDMLTMMPNEGEGFYESTHWPGEYNRFAHGRGQHVLGADGDELTLINEMQSDRNGKYYKRGVSPNEGEAPADFKKRADADKTARAAAKEKAGGLVDNWDEVMFRQLVQQAAAKGQKRVAWPSNLWQVAEPEQWDLDQIVTSGGFQSIVKNYTKTMPKLANKMAKKYGGTVGKMKVFNGKNKQVASKGYTDKEIANAFKPMLRKIEELPMVERVAAKLKIKSQIKQLQSIKNSDEFYYFEFDTKKARATKDNPMPINGVIVGAPAGSAAVSGQDEGK